MERWQTKITSLKDGIAHIYKTKEFSDVTFIVHGESFRAHKLVLAARSSTFAKQLLKPYELDEIIVDEKSVTKTGFEILLHFIYTDIIGTTDKKSIIQAYLAALYYGQTALQNSCKDVINSWIITTDDVFTLLDAGYSVDVLRERCIHFVKTNAQDVIASSHFASASLGSICIILKSDSLKNVLPLERIRHVMKWGEKRHSVSDNYSIVRNELHDSSLLSKLEFEKLSLSDLRDVDFDYPGLLTSEEITSFLRYDRCKNPAILPKWCSSKPNDDKSV